MVVPMLAPIIMPIACLNFIIPELTKPTTITVVADDDCITAVTPAPKRTAFIGLEVSFSSIFSNFPPDAPLSLHLINPFHRGISPILQVMLIHQIYPFFLQNFL